MDDEKQVEPHTGTDRPAKPGSIGEGVSNLVGSITTLVKDAASVVVDVAKSLHRSPTGLKRQSRESKRAMTPLQ